MDRRDHIHPLGDIAKDRVTVLPDRVRVFGPRIKAGLVLQHDRKVAVGAAWLQHGHRERAVGVAEPGLRGRLMLDARQDALGIKLGAALQQTVGLGLTIKAHRAVKDGAVEPAFLDIAQEVGGRDRRAFDFERDGDVPKRGLQHHIGGLVLRIRFGRIGDLGGGRFVALDLELHKKRVLAVFARRSRAIVKIVVRGDVEIAFAELFAQRDAFEIVAGKRRVEDGEGGRFVVG